jgi:hypothetical protein
MQWPKEDEGEKWKKSGQVFHRFINILQIEIQLSKREGWDSVNRYDPATFVCLFQASTWISSFIFSYPFLCSVS